MGEAKTVVLAETLVGVTMAAGPVAPEEARRPNCPQRGWQKGCCQRCLWPPFQDRARTGYRRAQSERDSWQHR